jgi:hypothetical protein
MTQVRPRHESGSFGRARTEALRAESVERTRAARTIASNCRDSVDRDHLLAMLGLPTPAIVEADTLATALRAYVRTVAAAVGVPANGTSCEVTDTATAYLALSRRWHAHPDRDLMLVWGERQGWGVAVETDPGEPPVVLAYLSGDPVPHPDEVARFVTESIASSGVGRRMVALSPAADRAILTERMNHWATNG